MIELAVLVILIIVGILVAVYGVCFANDIPEDAPWLFAIEAALTAASGVGIVIFALNGKPDVSGHFLLLAASLQGAFFIHAKRVGYATSHYGMIDVARGPCLACGATPEEQDAAQAARANEEQQ